MINEAISIPLRGTILKAYKNVIIQLRTLPTKLRTNISTKVKSDFRKEVKTENFNEESFDKLIKKIQSSIAYTKMISPRTHTGQTGHTRMQFGTESNGKGGSRIKKAHTNWHGSNMDPDSVSRHFHGLKRAGFSGNAHAKGVF